MEKNKKSLKEEEIKPFDLIKKQNKYIESDRNRLLDKKNNFVSISCPACESNRSNKVFMKNGLNYVICSSCETMFVNPRPTKEILEYCYSNSEVYKYWNKYIFPETDKARREHLYKERIERIRKICLKCGFKKNSTLIEVGAGFGSFCDEAKKTGNFGRVIAIEPTHDGANNCRKKNIETIEKSIEKISIKDVEPDIIVCFEVIEHLFSPKDFFNNCFKLLKPGGLIIVTCPNIKGFDNLIMGKQSSTIDHEHLNYFNPESLSILMLNCGFRIFEKLTPGKLDVQLVRNRGVLPGIISLDQQPFLKQIFIDKWKETNENFQKFLSDNLLSGHMWMVGLKK